MYTFEFKQHKLEVNWVTGVVVDFHQRTETHIHGSGGGGQIRAGHGKIEDIHFSSSHSHHKEIFLEDDHGAQHPLQLTNWNIPFARGHRLTVVWLIDAGKNWGPYTLVWNHTTGQSMWSEAVLASYCRNDWGKWIGYGALIPALAIYPFLGILASAVLAVLGGLAGLVLRASSYNVNDADAIKQKVLEMVRHQ